MNGLCFSCTDTSLENICKNYSRIFINTVVNWIFVFSQKASIAELEAQLEEERDQRKEERQKATSDLKAAVQRVQSEAQEEVKRLSNAALQQERELEEEINKLQVVNFIVLYVWTL
jgi:Skp family chaperone for outer membrane proteins